MTVPLPNDVTVVTIAIPGIQGPPGVVQAWDTASRPDASTLPAGYPGFDTTLGKPIWSNGTIWVDATGVEV